MKYANERYITIKHPVTGEPIQAVATGKRSEQTAEVMVITPGSNLWKIWIERRDVLKE